MNKNILYFTISLVLLCLIISCDKNSSKANNLNSKANTIPKKVDSLLGLMSIEEKVGQMNLYNGFWDVTGPVPEEGSSKTKYEHLRKGWVGAMLSVRGVENVRKIQQIAVEETRLGIPLLFGFDVIHGYKTLSPIPLAEAASWDLQAIENSARMAATEASAAGLNWTFAPMVDISRDARWGRIMEGAGEDPFYASLVARARVNGFQGDDLTDPTTIAACAKHFAGYGFVEAGREYNTVSIGNETLFNTVLPPFKAAVDAGVKSVMTSFNDLNGVTSSSDKFLMREILKDKWNFEGLVVSDWASIKEIIYWGQAKDKAEAAILASNAGCDLDMEGYVYIDELVKLVEEGKVRESVINEAVRRILTVKFELGLFEDPYRYCDAKREKENTGTTEHKEAVLDMAKKSMVLLKNESNLLPLKKEGLNIALIGQLADSKNSPLGSWRIASDDNTAVSVLEGMQNHKATNQITFEKGVDVFVGEEHFIKEIKVNEKDKSGIDQAMKVAENADVVIMVLGEHGFQSGEGRSRTELGLPGLQQEMLEAVYTVNKNIVLILNNGRPLAIPWAAEHIPAILEAWQLGTQTGNAVAQVLYGDYNPSGKLPVTFPRSVGQVPIYYNFKNTGRATDREGNVFWSHYIDEKNSPLFPFGHGLSYTTFEYSNLKLSHSTMSKEDTLEIAVNIKNTGSYEGKEVVQLYIRDLVGSIVRPVKELKGFELVSLKAGEQKTIKFKIDKAELGFYNNKGEFVVEPGDFKIFVGGSSETELESDFKLTD
jgi:beta-glucosidase